MLILKASGQGDGLANGDADRGRFAAADAKLIQIVDMFGDDVAGRCG